MSSPDLTAPSRSVLRGHLALARISNAPTVVSNTLAGAVLATTLTLDVTIVVVALVMVAFYTAGMYLNDILDLEIDRQQQPQRPLPSGLVSVQAAYGVVIALFGIGLVALAFVSWPAFVSGAVLVATICIYDAWHKGNPFGPAFMAATRALVYLTAFLAYSTSLTGELLIWIVLLFLYVAGLTSIAKTEHGPIAARSWPILAMLPPAIFAVATDPSLATIVLAVVFLGWVAYSCSFVYVETRRSIGRAIASLIAGVSLLDALVLATHDAWVGVSIALIAFGATLFFQRYIRGT